MALERHAQKRIAELTEIAGGADGGAGDRSARTRPVAERGGGQSEEAGGVETTPRQITGIIKPGHGGPGNI